MQLLLEAEFPDLARSRNGFRALFAQALCRQAPTRTIEPSRARKSDGEPCFIASGPRKPLRAYVNHMSLAVARRRVRPAGVSRKSPLRIEPVCDSCEHRI